MFAFVGLNEFEQLFELMGTFGAGLGFILELERGGLERRFVLGFTAWIAGAICEGWHRAIWH